jgi:aldehyde dehydrogenase (NAD+)
MQKLADLMHRDADILAGLESLDNGKPFKTARAVDIPASIANIRYYAGWADKIHGKVIPSAGNFLNYTRHEPVGVAGQIIPWNFPLLMLAWKIGIILGGIIKLSLFLVKSSLNEIPLFVIH